MQQLSTLAPPRGRSETSGERADGALRVGISSFAAWMLGVGSIIGSMAWLIHGPMLARSGSTACIVAWLVAGLISLPLALILMELASMFPAAGGPYVYKYYALKRLIPGMGELFGFLTGWLFWIALIVGLACMSNGLANLLASSIWGEPSASPFWFGPAVIAALFGLTTLLNLQPVNKAALVSNVFTLLKLAMALGFAGLVAFSPQASFSHVLQWTNPAGSSDFGGNVMAVLMLAMAGFSFIEITGCTSSETKDARSAVPKAMLMTLVTVTVIYVGMCLATSAASSYVLSGDGSTLVVPGTSIQATCPALAGLLGGSMWGTMFTAGVVASIVGCGFTALLAIARVSYSMARTGLFPARFARVCPRTAVPRYALWFQFWALCLIGVSANLLSRTGMFPDAYAFLAETFGFMYAFVAMLYGVCVVSLRYTDPDMPRAFRIGRRGNGLVWIVAAFTVAVWGFAAFFCVQAVHQIAGAAILAAGLPIYFYYRRDGSSPV